jgi:trehalose synthase
MPDARPRRPVDRDILMPTWVRRPPAHGARLVHVSAPRGCTDLLLDLVGAQATAGTPVGWVVLADDSESAATVAYLQRLLHDRADPAALTAAGIATRYRCLLAPQALWLARQLAPGDVVVLHDPATLALAPRLAGTGARLVWHCHTTVAAGSPTAADPGARAAPGAPAGPGVPAGPGALAGPGGPAGTGAVAGPNAGPAALWREFAAELSTLDAVVTTAADIGPPGVPPRRRYVCAPAVDSQSPRNRELSRDEVDDLLAEIGLTGNQPGDSPAVVVVQLGPVPAGARVVLHVASWDTVADLPGLVGCLPSLPADVHLVLTAAPDFTGAALDELDGVLAALSIVDRLRAHLVLPEAGGDPAASGLVLNAVHRRADVVLQASMADGDGLVVLEAMAKRRAVLLAGTREPGELPARAGDWGRRAELGQQQAMVAALRILLDDPRLCRELGERAAATVAGHSSMARLVADYRTFAAVRTPEELGHIPSLQATR